MPIGIITRTTVFTNVNTSIGAQTVVSGATIIVHGIGISAITATSVNIRRASDSSVIMTLRVPNNNTGVGVVVPFIADGGIEVIGLTANTAEVTILHSQPGR